MVFLLLPLSGACLDMTFDCGWALEEVGLPCCCTLAAGSYERCTVRYYCCYAYESEDPGPLFII